MANLKEYDIAFEHYRGRRRYIVSHPKHRRALIVAAPDEVSAMVAAAKKWGERWQQVSFYAYCDIKLCIYNRKKDDKTEGTD